MHCCGPGPDRPGAGLGTQRGPSPTALAHEVNGTARPCARGARPPPASAPRGAENRRTPLREPDALPLRQAAGQPCSFSPGAGCLPRRLTSASCLHQRSRRPLQRVLPLLPPAALGSRGAQGQAEPDRWGNENRGLSGVERAREGRLGCERPPHGTAGESGRCCTTRGTGTGPGTPAAQQSRLSLRAPRLARMVERGPADAAAHPGTCQPPAQALCDRTCMEASAPVRTFLLRPDHRRGDSEGPTRQRTNTEEVEKAAEIYRVGPATQDNQSRISQEIALLPSGVGFWEFYQKDGGPSARLQACTTLLC